MYMDLSSHAPISFTATAKWQDHAAARDSSSRCGVGSSLSLIVLYHPSDWVTNNALHSIRKAVWERRQ